MKCKVLFSLKNMGKKKNNKKMSAAAVLISTLRVVVKNVCSYLNSAG